MGRIWKTEKQTRSLFMSVVFTDLQCSGMTYHDAFRHMCSIPVRGPAGALQSRFPAAGQRQVDTRGLISSFVAGSPNTHPRQTGPLGDDPD